jgi:lycopene beta-cyclase
MPSESHNTTKGFYDYIITGAGCAGLSLLMHMIESGRFTSKKILIIDKDAKNKNDRTWCFWEKEDGLFQSVVKKQWNAMWFQAPGFSQKLDLQPYRYKLIRGIDLYNFCFEHIAQQPNITFLNAAVENISSDEKDARVQAGGNTYHAHYIFNSILFQKPIPAKKEYWLLQHFKGWLIKTEQPAFDEHIGTLMDFRTDQHEGTTFFYVLPFSATEALVEYTLFSKETLPDERYEAALQQYVTQTIGIKNYEIKEKEFGVIPMTNYDFPTVENRIIHLGTAGGQTKASSGYTFRFIQKHSKAIVESLLQGKPFAKPQRNRFFFYDSILLYILYHKTLLGADIFTDLFKKNAPGQVLKFLDNETNLQEELRIIRTLPTMPFLKAAIRQFTPLG